MAHPGYGPLSVFRSFWLNHNLILRLAWREIEGRYRGSALGLLWAVMVPLFMLAVYSFVFGTIFKTRWPNQGTVSESAFPIVLFAGLLLYNMFSEAMGRAAGLVRENPSFVKKIVFPLYVLPWVAVVSAAINAAVSFVILLLGHVVLLGPPPVTFLLGPVIALPLLLVSFGLVSFVAATGMFFRDLGHVVGIVTTALLFLSPVFYPAEAVPEMLRPYLGLNPLTVPVEGLRAVAIWGQLPAWQPFLLYCLAAWAVAWLGSAWFLKTQKAFADVL